MPAELLTADRFLDPAILLAGPVDLEMYNRFRERLEAAPAEGLVVVEMSTLGGDPEIARMMGEDIRFHSQHQPARRFVFLGKAMVYSAGVTFMSFFAPENRYLTRGARLMIHERKMSDQLAIEGPLTCCLTIVQAKLNELQTSIAIQNEGFENLARGSNVSFDDIVQRASTNWYVEAAEAKTLGLVAEVI